MKDAARIINDNFLHHATWFQSFTPGMQTIHAPGISYSDSGLSCDTFNILYVTEGFDAAEFYKAVQHYDNREFCVWINEENLTPEVTAALQHAGLKEAGNEPGMIIDLAKLPPVNITDDIRQLSTLDDFARLIAANWNPPDQNVIEYYKKVIPKNAEYFGSYVNDEIVSVVELFPDTSTNAGIYSLYTLPEHRGKGIGTNLMKHCLQYLQSKGFTSATLQAADDGLNIYKKLGFEPATRFYEFKK